MLTNMLQIHLKLFEKKVIQKPTEPTSDSTGDEISGAIANSYYDKIRKTPKRKRRYKIWF